MLNVPGTLTIKGCTINGVMHGVIVRGGTATISDSEITAVNDGDEANTQTVADYFNNRNWGSGNMVNLATLTMGNKDAASHAFFISANLLTFVLKSAGKYGFPSAFHSRREAPRGA